MNTGRAGSAARIGAAHGSGAHSVFATRIAFAVIRAPKPFGYCATTPSGAVAMSKAAAISARV